jgi:hypothetical protein
VCKADHTKFYENNDAKQHCCVHKRVNCGCDESSRPSQAQMLAFLLLLAIAAPLELSSGSILHPSEGFRNVNQESIVIPLVRHSRVNPAKLVKERVRESTQNLLQTELGHKEFTTLLQNVKSLQYVGQLYFGEKLQQFDCIFDTGSSNTWAYITDCNSQACRTHNRFDASGTTHRDKEIEIHYGRSAADLLLTKLSPHLFKCLGRFL